MFENRVTIPSMPEGFLFYVAKAANASGEATIDILPRESSTRLWGINSTNSVVIPQSLVLGSIV